MGMSLSYSHHKREGFYFTWVNIYLLADNGLVGLEYGRWEDFLYSCLNPMGNQNPPDEILENILFVCLVVFVIAK